MSRYPDHYRQELLCPTCPECKPNPDFLYWQDLPINPTIELKPTRYANIYHHTLYEALKVYGNHVGTAQWGKEQNDQND